MSKDGSRIITWARCENVKRHHADHGDVRLVADPGALRLVARELTTAREAS